MAVTQTGAIFHSLVFGGVDSADYGIYITGEAVYNAPERAVELVSVPGRNGALIIDQGRWENIEVTYPCGTFAKTQAEFATNLASFRNAILSQNGYNRLTDSYNTGEYRMATYIAGLEVSPTNIGIAGEFQLIFNAKPQRFLTSGESAVTVSNGGSLSNPTRYESKPLLQVTGTGTITIHGCTITITGNSSQVIYIDCDIMEAYSVSGSTVTNRNELITVSPDFPTLAPGSNTITKTTGTLRITPRWWQL